MWNGIKKSLQLLLEHAISKYGEKCVIKQLKGSDTQKPTEWNGYKRLNVFHKLMDWTRGLMD